MLDTTKMSVDEVREVLVSEYGLNRVEADSIKGKGAVVAKLREYESDEEILESAELQHDELSPVNTMEQATEDQVNIHHPKWTEYVLSLMHSDELFEGHPKVDGLRRVAELLRGPIRGVTSKIEQTPDLNNNLHATVKVTVATDDEVWDGCADAGPNNTDKKYAKHPVAVAESRAEGRAYRKLLRLRNILTAEESVQEEDISDDFEVITSAQTKAIDKLCNNNNISVEKFLSKHNINIADFNKTHKTVASELCRELNELERSGTIPEELQGYQFDWKM